MNICEDPIPGSALSPYVHRLVTEHSHSIERLPHTLDQDGFLDFQTIAHNLPEYTADSCEYFTECVKCAAKMFHSVEDHTKTLRADYFFLKYEPFLNWTGDAKLLKAVWQDMFVSHPPCSVDQLSVLLVTTAVLERSLGNLYLSKGPAPCPSMLKDLLLTDELGNLLGRNVITVLRLLIGPPVSLNLRNLVWHGFPFPGEIPERCVWFIMMLVPSIGLVLHKQGITDVTRREPVIFPETRPILETSVFNSIDWINTMECRSTITKVFWQKVACLYTQQRYSECCALLLYYLEQELRRLFTKANKCEHRILTAQESELFTTFDEMLSPSMPDGTINQLQSVLGDDLLEILLDHLAYQHGPRVRDRLSHGEASWEQFPRQLVENMATIVVAIATRDLPCVGSPVEEVHTAVRGYKVQFHRISILKEKILELCKIASEIDSNIKILPDLSPRSPESEYPLSDEYRLLESEVIPLAGIITSNWSVEHRPSESLQCLQYRELSKFYHLLESTMATKITTLYREKQRSHTDDSDVEGEILSVLHHIVEECTSILRNVRQFALLRYQQLEGKQLRSRQRDNLSKFLSSFPSYVLATCFCSYLCSWQLFHLDLLHKMRPNCTKLVKFWKATLQFSENLRTCSQCDKNKWTDGTNLITQFIKYVKSNIGAQPFLILVKNNKD